MLLVLLFQFPSSLEFHSLLLLVPRRPRTSLHLLIKAFSCLCLKDFPWTVYCSTGFIKNPLLSVQSLGLNMSVSQPLSSPWTVNEVVIRMSLVLARYLEHANPMLCSDQDTITRATATANTTHTLRVRTHTTREAMRANLIMVCKRCPLMSR